MNNYIPLEVLDAATKALIEESLKIKGTVKSAKDEFEICYETIQLKEAHSGIPTLYKIVLRYPRGPVETRSLWGVWTAKGQRLQLQ